MDSGSLINVDLNVDSHSDIIAFRALLVPAVVLSDSLSDHQCLRFLHAKDGNAVQAAEMASKVTIMAADKSFQVNTQQKLTRTLSGAELYFRQCVKAVCASAPTSSWRVCTLWKTIRTMSASRSR
jgi:hypothetical protein